MNDFFKRLIGRLCWESQWRCAEPVLVIESDDWGLQRKNCSELLSRFGEPKDWGQDQLETVENLEGLYQSLAKIRDASGRFPLFTANFIVANPDFEAIASHHFSAYYETSILQDHLLMGKWQEGMQRKVFFPQYHGRSHFWPEAWLKDLRSGFPGAMELFEQRCHGGLTLLKGKGWRYHTEYLDWASGQVLSGGELQDWLKGGLDIFHQVFGFFPQSTIAPHYIFAPETAAAWYQAGVRFVQGSNYLIKRGRGGEQLVVSHAMGEHLPQLLYCLARTVRFEPRPAEHARGVENAKCQILDCFQNHVPAVIDTHRINYTGPWRQSALQALETLLAQSQAPELRYLSSVELGQAIAQNGHYQDIWTGEHQHLTPINPPIRRSLRKLHSLIADRLAFPVQ